jgi:hypothetical protein
LFCAWSTLTSCSSKSGHLKRNEDKVASVKSARLMKVVELNTIPTRYVVMDSSIYIRSVDTLNQIGDIITLSAGSAKQSFRIVN